MNSINPYDLLNVSSESSITYLKKNYYQLALYCHPDKGGSKEDMVIVQNAYEYLKIQLENSTEKTYEDLENEFQDFCSLQEKEPPKFCKIFSETHEEWNNEFNNTYLEQKYSDLFDKGYGEFMDISQNQNYQEYKPIDEEKNKHNFKSEIVIYKEPFPTPIDVDTNMPLDKKEIKDFTYQGMTDYKLAFSSSENLKINIRNRTLEDIIKERNTDKKILIVYKNSKNSGNYYTALRISKYFNDSKLHNCENKLTNSEIKKYDHIIALHFLKCHDFLEQNKGIIPYSIIFTGTDCNLEITKSKNYVDVLDYASNIITFNSEMKKRIMEIYKVFKQIHIIPQAVESQFQKVDIEENDYYLWVGKLRTIKNPELLFEIAAELPDKNFIMIGDKDKEYEMNELPKNIKHLGILDRNMVLNYIIKSNGLINTSIEEGMSDTILSAMALGIPVLVRDNTGNRSIVNDKTGYFFNDKNDFKLIKINNKNSLNAKIYIHNNHNLSNEHIEYQKLII
jgi:glycosyltransferase involved in cell wall biosynthesis